MLVRKGRRTDSKDFIGLVRALADFEHLEPPTKEGERRLLTDIFGRRRINLLVAAEGPLLVGYALYFFSYSSFLAKPTLYLEDLFVLEEHRKKGAGIALFRRCVNEALSEGCGRMEWSVLDWNEKAQKFYEGIGARRLKEWYLYRLDERSLGQVLKKVRA